MYVSLYDKLNLFEVTASTIIRQTTYVLHALQCARTKTMQSSKQVSSKVTLGQHCVEDKPPVSIKHRLPAPSERFVLALSQNQLALKAKGRASTVDGKFILPLHACNLLSKWHTANGKLTSSGMC